MKKLSVIFLLFISVVQFAGAAVTKQEADAAYQKNDFSAAIAGYEEILATQGESADIYYNLGNAYYKNKNIAKAVLNYERALLLRPGDADIRFNLEMARSKTVDQITPTAEVFIVTWYKSLVNMTGERNWSWIGIFSFIFCLFAVTFYIFGKKLWLRKVGFIAAAVLLAFVRPFVFRLFASRDAVESIVPSWWTMGGSSYLKYAFVCILVHHAALFSVEYFSFAHVWQVMLHVVCSSVLTLLCVLAIEFMRRRR